MDAESTVQVDTATNEPGVPITRDMLSTVSAISVLGQITASALLATGQVTLFLNHEGIVEAAPTREVSLDAIPEVTALQVLGEAGYTDEMLTNYLRGRDTRRTQR